MLNPEKAFASFSVDDTAEARRFYAETLGLDATEIEMPGLLALRIGGGTDTLIYPKGNDHVPASHTVLNFPVEDIDAAVDWLVARGVEPERYEGFDQDEKGIARGGGERGPSIAWFTDPAGNVLSVLEME